MYLRKKNSGRDRPGCVRSNGCAPESLPQAAFFFLLKSCNARTDCDERHGGVCKRRREMASSETTASFARPVTQVFFQWNIEIKKLLAVHLHPCEVHMSAGFRVIDPGDIKEDKPAVDGVWL